MSVANGVAPAIQSQIQTMPESESGLTDGCGAPPFRSAHLILIVLRVAVTGMSALGDWQVPSYSPVFGTHLPKLGAPLALLMSSGEVPTDMIKLPVAPASPLMLKEMPVYFEASTAQV